MGRTLHSWLTGRIEDRSPTLTASQFGGSDVAGGYIFEPTLSKMVIDLARSNSVCLRAGAQTIQMDSNELHLVTVDSDPTASWRSETVAVPASVASFGRITLRSKTLACIVPISLELLEDAGADSYGVIGPFNEMLIGMRSSGVIFRRIPAGTATDSDGTTWNATSQLLEHLVAHVRIDIALMRPSWFTVLTGIQSA